MATATNSTPHAAPESRVVLHDVSWSLYQEIAGSRGERPVPRLTFVDGSLELMSPSYWHEALADRFRVFVWRLAEGLDRPCLGAGSTRWEKAGLLKGKEPDACFYLANAGAVLGLKSIDLEVHPPPDLAVEIEISQSLTQGLRVYADLGVPEVWVSDGETVRFLHLGGDAASTERETSLNFPPLRSSEAAAQLALADGMDLVGWGKQVEAWARRDLAGRGGPPPAP